MRIAIDIQGIQSDGSRNRGIGRYSLQIIRNLINQYSEVDFILVANSSLYNVKDKFKEELKKNKRVTYFSWYSPQPISFLSQNKNNIILGTQLRNYTFSCLHVDIIIFTSYIEGSSDNCLTTLTRKSIDAPIVSIFYDLIPLLQSEKYLKYNPDFTRFYHQKLREIKKLDALFCISKSCSKEAIDHLNFKENNVYNISCSCDKNMFKPRKVNHYIENINIEEFSPYILYTGAGDPRKNIEGLIKAYSQLPKRITIVYKLVLSGKLINEEVKQINAWIEKYNINKESVILLGYVSDENLVTLYSNASLFVFPSFHEGFGLPILEAMCCETPVIGSNCTSIPEIISLKDAMFDPNNTQEITNLIKKSLDDENFKSKLIENSRKQSIKFSWEDSVTTLMNACKEIISKQPIKTCQFEWSAIRKNNNKNLDILLKKIFKKEKLHNNVSDDDLKKLAASINKINIQLNSHFRNLARKKDISKWKVEGPFDSSYSLAILNRNFTSALSAELKDVAINITEGPGDYKVDTRYLSQYPEIYSKYLTSLKTKIEYHDVVSRNLYPPRVEDLDAMINLLHSYGWEESELPQDWVDDFNRYLQGITVMSNQVKKILIDNGVKIPISVCGIGVDHIQRIKESNTFDINAKRFKFLHISSCFPRKGIDILLKAYGNTFTRNDDVSLIIKTFTNEHNNVDKLLKLEKDKNYLYPDVLLIKEDLNDNDLKALYLMCDALVAPSRGEGFGLPIAEAMLLKLPVITTNWGGQLDYCDPQNSWLIDYKFVTSDSHFNQYLSYWAEPSVDHLSKLLKSIYFTTTEKISSKVDKGYNSIHKKTWQDVSKKNIFFTKNLLNKSQSKDSKIGWISTWNSKCGIASYSQNLIKNMNKEVIVFSPTNEEKVDNLNQVIIPSWEQDSSNKKCFAPILEKIKSYKIKTIVIQFNYGFFHFENLIFFLESLYELKVSVIIFMHSTKDPESNANKKLIYLVNTLKKVDRIMVHSISDLNRLKAIGLIENICLFPHGIIENKNENNLRNTRLLSSNLKTESPLNICTFGFCLPNKGFEELIHAIHLLSKKEFPVQLKIFSALYRSEYSWYYEKLISLIKKLMIEDIVEVYPEYLTEQCSLNMLSKSDLIILPNQSSNESSSASARHALATGKPLLVTPINLFDNISNLVDYLPGMSSEEIALGIEEWLLNNNKSPKINNDIKILRLELINKLSFSRVGDRLQSIIESLDINKN